MAFTKGLQENHRTLELKTSANLHEHINPDVFVFKISVLFHPESDTSSWHTGLPGVEKQTSGALKMIFEPEPRLFLTFGFKRQEF